MTAQSRECPFTQVIIIGAGISGLAMACQLKRQLNCKDLVIYDRAPGLGGTWYTNTCTFPIYYSTQMSIYL